MGTCSFNHGAGSFSLVRCVPWISEQGSHATCLSLHGPELPPLGRRSVRVAQVVC